MVCLRGMLLGGSAPCSCILLRCAQPIAHRDCMRDFAVAAVEMVWRAWQTGVAGDSKPRKWARCSPPIEEPPGFAICRVGQLPNCFCWPGIDVNDMMTFMPPSRRTLFEVAEPHSGWFRASDAVASGVSRQQLARYAASGVLSRSTHGVYRLNDFPAEPFEDVIEACLWAGSNAVASHATALAVYGLGNAMPASIHLTVPRRLRKHRPGVIVRIADVATEATSRNGVPVTSVFRAILDVADEVSLKDVSALIDEAEANGLLRRRELKSLRKSLAVSA